jgi:hypothetical protein
VRISPSGDTLLGFSLQGAAPGASVAVDGSSARYQGIMAGIDLVEQVNGGALKETLVFTAPPPPGTSGRFRFPLNLKGVTPAAKPDGSISFADGAGPAAATMPAGIAYVNRPGSDGGSALPWVWWSRSSCPLSLDLLSGHSGRTELFRLSRFTVRRTAGSRRADWSDGR